MSTLPAGWAETTLGEVGQWKGGGTPSKSNSDFWEGGNVPWVSPKDMKLSKISKCQDYITEKAVRETSVNELDAGSILIVTRSGILAHSMPVAMAELKVTVNQDLKAISPNSLTHPEYLLGYLRAKERHILQTCRKAGTTVASLDTAKLQSFTLALPPLAEQKRIVEKLEALSARITAAKAHLDHSLTQATRAKQAVLASELDSCSGTMIELGHVATEIRYGTSKKCDYNGGATPVLRIPNIVSGRINCSELKSANFEEKEISKLALKRGDLLIVRSNGSVNIVGRSAIVRDSEQGYLFAGYLIRVRLDDRRANPEFVQLALESAGVRYQIEGSAKSTSGVNNINSKQVSSLSLPMPPLETQREIVARIESAFAKIDAMVEQAQNALRLLERLEQQLLAKAFRGELVPQDPDDEPASALLERIRAERAAQSKNKSAKPKRARKAKTA